MERIVSSLRVRLIGVVLVILAALVPPLYLGISAIVREGYAERFVNSLRVYSRLVEIGRASCRERVCLYV